MYDGTCCVVCGLVCGMKMRVNQPSMALLCTFHQTESADIAESG